MAKQPSIYSLSCLGEKVEAYYTPTEIPQFNGNKYIMALPVYDRVQIAEHIHYRPPFNSAIRQASVETRILALEVNFAQFFQALTPHADYGLNIFNAIKLGLGNRNPEDSRYVERTTGLLSELNTLWETETLKEVVQPRQHFRQYDYHEDRDRILYAGGQFAGYHGFHFVGHAGMGKTVATCSLLKAFPQLLYHPKLDGPFSTARQLVWFMQSTPYDGSLKALCRNFLHGVSVITGERYDVYYQADHDRTTVTKLMLAMATVSALLNLGVYILDEIQYLLHSRGQNHIWVLNFLNDLTSALGVPVIMMGTYPALELLGGEFRQLRRGLEQPQQDWHPLPFTTLGNKKPVDDSWRVFMQSMWEYQFTHRPVELDEYWNTFFHQHSMGVIDIARKLFIFSQIRAMLSPDEMLTPDIILSVYRDYFSKIERYAEIYHKRQWHRLTEFPDYPDITIQEFIEKDRQIEAYPTLAKLVSSEANGQKTSQMPLTETAVENTDEHEEEGSQGLDAVVKSVVEANSLPTDDLRRVAKEGETRGLSPAQALEETGDVVDPVKFLEEWTNK
jgi:hypothetical protein